MGSEHNLPKRHYDLSMSRRTRKPSKLHDDEETGRLVTSSTSHDIIDLDHQSLLFKVIVLQPVIQDVHGKGDQAAAIKPVLDDDDKEEKEEEVIEKQMISIFRCAHDQGGDLKAKPAKEGGGGKRNPPLGYYLKEQEKENENLLQLVPKGKGVKGGVKFGRMVNRYVKVLSHLMTKVHPHYHSKVDTALGTSSSGSGNKKQSPLLKLTM